MAENLAELTAAVNDVGVAFNEYKSLNDRRVAEIEKKGSADPLTEEAVKAANDNLSKLDDRLRGLEAYIARPRVGLTGDKDRKPEEIKSAHEWLGMVRGQPVDYVDFGEIEKYGEVMDAYLRKGMDRLSDHQRQTLDGHSDVKALSVGVQTEGGYWVRPQISDRLVQNIFETSPIRQIAMVEQVTTDALEFVVDKDQAAASWVGETESRSETATPDIATARIPVHELHAQPKATQKILEDANINVEQWLSDKVADKFSRTENTAFVSGNGVGKPRGFLDYPAVANASWSWGNVGYIATGNASGFPSSDPADVLYDTVGALKAGYRAGARWVMNRATLTEVRKFKDANGQYLWQPSLIVGQPSSLLGFPVSEGEDMPDLAANALAIVFGNMATTYTIVDRLGISVLRDPFTAKPHVLFDTRKRVGGDVVNFESYKVVKVATS